MAQTVWTYVDPANIPKDTVRFFVGDTDERDPLLSDAEINYLLSIYPSGGVLNASIRACEMIAMKFSRMANEAVGSVRIDYNQKYKAYIDMKTALIARIATETISPFCGGISRTQVQQNLQNNDLIKPDFTKHMMENQQISPWVTCGVNSGAWQCACWI
jgi:hypothetical protein